MYMYIVPIKHNTNKTPVLDSIEISYKILFFFQDVDMCVFLFIFTCKHPTIMDEYTHIVTNAMIK